MRFKFELKFKHFFNSKSWILLLNSKMEGKVYNCTRNPQMNADGKSDTRTAYVLPLISSQNADLVSYLSGKVEFHGR